MHVTLHPTPQGYSPAAWDELYMRAALALGLHYFR